MKRYILFAIGIVVVGAAIYLYADYNNTKLTNLANKNSAFEHLHSNGEVETVVSSSETETAVKSSTTPLESDSSAEENAGVMTAGAEEISEPAPIHAASGAITMMIAGGCFWCVEADLEKLDGVLSVISGYAEGTNQNPTYENYSKHGHREVVEVLYDPNRVSYEQIVIYTIKHMDPTDGNGSFGDRGAAYAPAVYYKNSEEKMLLEKLIAEIDAEGPYSAPLALDVLPVTRVWPAEEYHQDYYVKNPIRYKSYRFASGRDRFVSEHWGSDTGPTLSWREVVSENEWSEYVKPGEAALRAALTDLQYRVTQEEFTERPFDNEYHDSKAVGIYVDVVSGEPLFSSTHKFDSGTGWPSFTRPIEYYMVTEHADYKLIVPRTEIRSRYADSHLGHVFNDAPAELGGIRYCMNSASLRFVAREDMASEGYEEYLYLFN